MYGIKAIGFDLGDTLIEYEGFPLSWAHYYPEVLGNITLLCGCAPDETRMNEAGQLLARYNTRITPREREVDSDEIFTGVLECLGADPRFLNAASDEFFRFFQQRTRIFPETLSVLKELRQRGIRTGILTDVPYGMKRSLVERDIERTGLTGFFDCVVSSGEAGFRKPHPAAYRLLMEKLSVRPEEMLFVGNEKKDIEGANAASIKSVLIDRSGTAPDFGETIRITTLDAIPGLTG